MKLKLKAFKGENSIIRRSTVAAIYENEALSPSLLFELSKWSIPIPGYEHEQFLEKAPSINNQFS